MARRVFFSFEYSDVSRAMVVRNASVTQGEEAVGIIDAAEFEKIENQGTNAVQTWIDAQLKGTSVTVVLVGENTCSSKWVKYEIDQSVARGNGLLGIDISKIKSFSGATTKCCGHLPSGYSFYAWNDDNGYANLASWVEKAAKDAGR